MSFFWKKIIGIVIVFLSIAIISIQQIFSQEEGFGVLEITFHTGVNSPEIIHLQEVVNLSGGNFTGFWIQIKNTSERNEFFKLNFGTQIHTNDTENILGCQFGEDATNTFPQNMIYETGDFEVIANSGVYKYIELRYSACSSGTNLGCIAVQKAGNSGMGIFDVELSRIGFIDFDVTSDILNCNSINITAFQEKRNLFPSDQKILPNQRTVGSLKLYSLTGGFVTSGYVNIGRGGTGKVEINKSLSGNYIATFQGLSSLKAMISGIAIDLYQRTIDFSTGENIFGTTIEDRNEDNISDDGYLYLKVGEISPYDGEINGDDIAKLLPSINKTNEEYGLNKYDIDGDGGVTIADIGIIIYNLHKRSVGNEYSDTGLLPRMLP